MSFAASEVQAYDKWHQSIGGFIDPLSLPWYRSVFNYLNTLELKGSLLEVGCGRGEFSRLLADKNTKLDVTGIDFSLAAIELAKSVPTQARFTCGDAESLPHAADTFDFVVSCECIEHVLNPALMVREIARVLKPGGTFALTTESYLNGMLLAWLASVIRKVPFNSGSGIQPRENFFFFWNILSYLNSSGLVVQETDSSHFQWLLLPRVDPAKLCTKEINHPMLKTFAKPFGRHFSFFGRKPISSSDQTSVQA